MAIGLLRVMDTQVESTPGRFTGFMHNYGRPKLSDSLVIAFQECSRKRCRERFKNDLEFQTRQTSLLRIRECSQEQFPRTFCTVFPGSFPESFSGTFLGRDVKSGIYGFDAFGGLKR